MEHGPAAAGSDARLPYGACRWPRDVRIRSPRLQMTLTLFAGARVVSGKMATPFFFLPFVHSHYASSGILSAAGGEPASRWVFSSWFTRVCSGG